MSSRIYQCMLAAALLVIAGQAFAQSGKAAQASKKEPEVVGPNGAKAAGDDANQSLRRESPSEVEAAIVPYINNYFETFLLGPEDVITVHILGQQLYSRSNMTMPPDGR